MLIDNDPMVSSYISVPKEMSQLNCAAFVAGIIEAVLDGCLFPSRVTAHSVPTDQYPGKTVFLSAFLPSGFFPFFGNPTSLLFAQCNNC
jgi:hypothetical protein